MLRLSKSLLLFVSAILILSCEPEEESLQGSAGAKLTFSNDTVLFDTLLTIRSSITRRFRIYNPNPHAVQISDIRLGKGEHSAYSIIVNGKSATSVKDEILFGGDSLLVLVDVTIDPKDTDLPYLVKDSVIVEWNDFQSHVKLVAWGQDAHFIHNQVICDELWTAGRPYVIYDAVLVDSLCSLTIEPGAKVYLDNGAAFYVKGSLKVLGDSGRHVSFRNTRFDERYLVAPGQWDAIYFLEGSQKNEIRYAEIENGTIGLRVGTPDEDAEFDLVVSHTSIRHMSGAGILAFTSDVRVFNTEIYNAASYLVGNFAGGNYRYEHCTFSNTPSSFITDDPMIQFSDNVILSDTEVLVGDLTLHMANCILWGEGDSQLLLSTGGGAAIDTSLIANVIKSDVTIAGNYTSTARNYPGFKDPYSFDFSLDSLAFARNKGIITEVKDDIEGNRRDDIPDIGAYERTD